MKNARFLPLVVGALVLFGCAKRQAGFGPAELTKEELVWLYDIPVQDKPSHKFEWRVATPRYFRLVVEESVPKSGIWKSIHTVSYRPHSFERAVVLLMEDRCAKTEGGSAWTIKYRFGGGSRTTNVFLDGQILLPLASRSNFGTRMSLTDPGQMMVFEFAEREYRFRLESSDKPFAE